MIQVYLMFIFLSSLTRILADILRKFETAVVEMYVLF